jgi:ABC-type phosphate transport system substrate-binding protein
VQSQNIKYALFLWTLLFTNALKANEVHAEVVVVVSAKSTVITLNRAEVARIFLGKTTTFPNGESAVPLDQADNNSTYHEFYTKVTSKSAAQLKAYWSKIIFAGDGQPPKALANSDAIKKNLTSNTHAIGYLDRSAVDDSLKIVLVP